VKALLSGTLLIKGKVFGAMPMTAASPRPKRAPRSRC